MAQSSLRWFGNTAWTFLGYQNDSNSQCKNAVHGVMQKKKKKKSSEVVATNESGSGFQLPLHYPRYSKAEYQKMEEWKVDTLLREYGLSFQGTLDQKRAYAMGTFLWPDKY